MQAQQSKPTHGKPSRANPPTHGFSKKKKKKTNRKSETYPLYHDHVVAEITEKINPKILRQYKDYNQSKIKTYKKKKQKQCTKLNTDSVPKKTKKKTPIQTRFQNGKN